MSENGPPFWDRRRESGHAPTVPSALERHIQTVVVAVMCALLAWMGNKVASTGEIVAALRAESIARIDRLQAEMAEVKQQLDSAYLMRDALRDLSYRDTMLDSLKARIRDLEQRLGTRYWQIDPQSATPPPGGRSPTPMPEQHR